jgi:hypothetical protein
MRETMDRPNSARSTVSAREFGEGEPPRTTSTAYESGPGASTEIRKVTEHHAAAVREDDSDTTFQNSAPASYTEPVACDRMNRDEAAIAPGRSAPTLRTVVRRHEADRMLEALQKSVQISGSSSSMRRFSASTAL